MALTQISTQGIKDGTITGSDLTTNIDLVDSQKIRFGTGNDLQIYHDGTNSRIHSSSHNLYIRTGGIFGVFNGAGSETMLKATVDGAVELYHDNSKKFETTSSGATITGNLIATGNLNVNDNGNINVGNSGDLQLFHNGTNSFIDSDSGNLVISSVADLRFNSADYKFMNTADNETLARFIQNGAVELYHDGTKRFETTTTGVKTLGDVSFRTSGNTQTILYDESDGQLEFVDTIKAVFGTGSDLQIYHDGNSRIQNTNNSCDFRIQSDSIELKGNSSDEMMLKGVVNGAVELYHNNSKKFETHSGGVSVFGNLSLTSADSHELRLGAGSDLKLFHDGTDSRINNSTGALQITGNNDFRLKTNSGQNIFKATGSAVELYFDAGSGSSKKLETYNGGVEVFGDLSLGDNRVLNVGTGSDLQISHDGTNSIINENGTGQLQLQVGGSTKFNTQSGGVQFYGSIFGDDQNKIELGNDQDLKLYHDGHSVIQNTHSSAAFLISSHATHIVNAALTQNIAKFKEGTGGVELYYNNSKQFETTSTGTTTFGTHHSTSDIALKTNIKPITNTLEKIQQITGYKYKFIKSNENSIGVVAQEVEKVFPELVNGTEGNKTLQYNGLIGVLIEAVKELSAEVAALKAS